MLKLGIIGGGQLGMMMVDACNELGISTFVLESSKDCSCAHNATHLVVGAYNDLDKLTSICENVDFITYEFENVDLGVLRALEDKYEIPQGSNILYISQNRIREKDFANSVGFKTAKYYEVKDNEDLIFATKTIGYPAILKTVSGGYDGKGQFILRSDADLFHIDREYIYEEMIDFDYEISCIGSRSINNDVVIYPLFKNEHKNGILYHTSFLENEYLNREVSKIMERFMNTLNYRGTLCVELFVKGNEFLFNEMAPRPHNSGHMTIEACKASQYKNHVLGVLGLKLESPEVINNTEMFNILGEDIIRIDEMKKEKNCVIHSYYKSSIKPKRKMGHVTFVNASKEEINSFVNKYIKESKDE